MAHREAQLEFKNRMSSSFLETDKQFKRHVLHFDNCRVRYASHFGMTWRTKFRAFIQSTISSDRNHYQKFFSRCVVVVVCVFFFFGVFFFFSPLARILGEFSTIHSPLALFKFFFFISKWRLARAY